MSTVVPAETIPLPLDRPSLRTPASLAGAALPILFGVLVTLCVRGYRYGESNHAVYLLAAIRQSDPALLARDWWTNSTLQYHYAFNFISGLLMRLGVIGPAFLIGYVALARRRSTSRGTG